MPDEPVPDQPAASHPGDPTPGESAALPPLLTRSLGEGLALAREVQQGFPVAAVEKLLEAGVLEPEEVYRLVIPRRTLSHRRAEGQPLTAEESNRLARLASVVRAALGLFGEPEVAARWLRRPNRALEGRAPIELLDSDAGARVIEQVLGRIEHGVYT